MEHRPFRLTINLVMTRPPPPPPPRPLLSLLQDLDKANSADYSVCVCVRACVRACVRVCVLCVCVCVCAYVRARMLSATFTASHKTKTLSAKLSFYYRSRRHYVPEHYRRKRFAALSSKPLAADKVISYSFTITHDNRCENISGERCKELHRFTRGLAELTASPMLSQSAPTMVVRAVFT